MQIRGTGSLSQEHIDAELAAGARIVRYEYCISLLFITLRQCTVPYLLRAHELGIWRGLPFTLVTLLLGWWGIPWGIIYTPMTILTNLSGGRDVTAEVRPVPEPSTGA